MQMRSQESKVEYQMSKVEGGISNVKSKMSNVDKVKPFVGAYPRSFFSYFVKGAKFVLMNSWIQ